MRRLFLVLLSVVACTQGGGGGGNAPQARPVATPKPCPWSGGGVITDGDLSESVNVSVLLVEREGKDTTVMVDQVVDSTAGIFTPLPPGTSVLLHPYEQKLFRQFAFSQLPGTFRRDLTLSFSGNCDNETDPVRAEVSFGDGRYAAQPDALSFPTVAIGAFSPQFVELINDSNGSVVFDLSVPPGAFEIEEGSALVPVGAHSREFAQLRFRPIATGTASSTLTVRAGVNFQKLIPLQGTEGGGRIEASPSPVDFGTVAYFPQVPINSIKSRYVVLENVGTAKADGGAIDFSGSSDKQLFFSAPNPTPFSLKIYWVSGAPWTGYGFKLDPGESATVRIDLLPKSLGRFSSSFKLATAPLTLVGEIQVMPPCSLTTNPDPLGVPLDGGVATFSLTNAGADLCQLHGFSLDQPADWFELLEDVNLDATLDAGATLDVHVRATATAFEDAGATLRFSYSSDSTPSQGVPVVAIP